jgi:Matrixin/Glucodextranase, domain B
MQLVRLVSWLYVCLIALAGISSAQQTVNLKKRLFRAPGNLDAYRVSPLLRRNSASSHFLIQFSAPPSSDQVQELRRRGARITSYIPDGGLMVSSPDNSSWDGLGLEYVGRMDALDKLSPQLSERLTLEETEMFVIVEFHNDVDMDEARQLVLERGLKIIERDNLLPYTLLVQGPLAKLMRLPDWDEVAYVFPASPELINGEPVIACGGPITEEAPIAQYVKIGAGWPRTGPAGSPLALDYVFGTLTTQLAAGTVKAEIVRALNEWVRVANIKFSQGQSATGARTINMFFGSRSHGDPYAFDGPGGVLGHTFYPAPGNSEPIAGDMHLDADEIWRVGASIDLYSVTLHELGHALGLGHSDLPSAVMYPYYKMSRTLSADDIAGIQALYGPPTAGQGGGTPAPAPSPLAIAVSSPASGSTTTATTVSVTGTASGGTGTLVVTWANNRGGSGTASGTANWSIASVALGSGTNQITITVTDGTNATAAKTVVVTRNDPPAQLDKIGPTVQITSPGAATYATSAASITLSGTASDDVGVVAVRWSNTFGGGAAASGTANWQASNIALLVGTNKITVTAFDAAGNSGTKLITVTRR